MRRAIVVVGASSIADFPVMREFALLAMDRIPRGATPHAWEEVARLHGFESFASWLVLVGGARAGGLPSPGLFEGCREAVSEAQAARVAERIDALACRSRVVTNAEVIAARCAVLRRKGRKLVFTNGVFDLFHVGHLRLLQAARALGGALVVGVNADESARRLKGRGRPLVPQFARAAIVAGVRGVDLTALFSEDDPRELLRLVHPDILVKGSEYAPADVVGGSLVEGWGGAVRLVPHVSGWSSTHVVEKAQGEGK